VVGSARPPARSVALVAQAINKVRMIELLFSQSPPEAASMILTDHVPADAGH
jgi:hypothetical protein